ncbi:hypothetical protein BLNAU_12355 [Blattamonas nauphoetae]|uniref:Uncharacterized protein n=1 Tax=Blattamonas nauphoetae TaxID=2049346 RepID=A0ABQ9XQW6_9EUKA|nr:hypothetical protein BLNAU_12355 [Blattamonas nauphoetae]
MSSWASTAERQPRIFGIHHQPLSPIVNEERLHVRTPIRFKTRTVPSASPNISSSLPAPVIHQPQRRICSHPTDVDIADNVTIASTSTVITGRATNTMHSNPSMFIVLFLHHFPLEWNRRGGRGRGVKSEELDHGSKKAKEEDSPSEHCVGFEQTATSTRHTECGEGRGRGEWDSVGGDGAGTEHGHELPRACVSRDDESDWLGSVCRWSRVKRRIHSNGARARRE